MNIDVPEPRSQPYVISIEGFNRAGILDYREVPPNLVRIFMERLGYVRKERYEEVVKERDDLRRTVAELEAKIKGFKERRSNMEERVENMRKSLELIEAADMPVDTALGLIKKGIDFLLKVLKEEGD